jgi:hypothetical protein
MSDKRKTHWKEAFNPAYIGAYAFQPSEEKTLTIAGMTIDTVKGSDGREDDCTILHWAEKEKPMVLNATNAKIISRLLNSPYIDDWIGKRIVLGVETVSAFGERVDAVRVQSKQPAKAAEAKKGTINPPAPPAAAEPIDPPAPLTIKERVDGVCKWHKVSQVTFGNVLKELQTQNKVADKPTAEMSAEEVDLMIKEVSQAIINKKKENQK